MLSHSSVVLGQAGIDLAENCLWKKEGCVLNPLSWSQVYGDAPVPCQLPHQILISSGQGLSKASPSEIFNTQNAVFGG